MRKFLVIQTASIGDVVLATSVLEELHKNYPNEDIDFVLKKGNESLFTNHPFIGKLWVWDKEKNKYNNLCKLIKEIRKTDYEYVININRFFSSGLITAFSNSKQKIGFKKNPLSLLFTKREEHIIDESNYVHEIERNCKLISELRIKSKDNIMPPKLYIPKEVDEMMKEYKNQTYYTVSPASLWYTKQFPKEGWEIFLKQVPKDAIIYLLGAPSDNTLCQEIKEIVGNPNCIDLSGKLNYLQSTSLMRDAKMNYTNDSAPLHFCTSVNAPLTAIFCSTVPEYGFTPIGDDVVIVQTDNDLYCRPCGLHGYKKCPEKHFNCSKTIEISKLVDRL